MGQSVYKRMVAFKSRLTFKYVFLAKPARFGINVWEEAIAQNECVHEVQIYIGNKSSAKRGIIRPWQVIRCST